MHPQLKANLASALDKFIDQNAELTLWDGYIHDELHIQMADAAAAVFDSAMQAQKHYEHETEPMKK